MPKLSDIEDADLLATKVQLDQLENKMDARFNGIDAKFISLQSKILTLDARIIALEGKLDKVSRTIWLPAVAAIAQILFLIFHRQLGF